LEDGSGAVPFDCIIAHEIKSPLRAIDGYARLFIDDGGPALSPKVLGMLENIRCICGDAISLADKLLEYSRVSGRALAEETVDLASVARDAFVLLSAAHAPRGGARLVFVSELPCVMADRELMRQAVTNILSNSLKFSIDGKPCEIAAGCERSGGDDVFFFSDNGAGFDMRHPADPFDMFQRMHRAGEFEGSGVGLAIVRRAVEMHGGRVWLTGEAGRGATVRFTLPPGKVLR
jgi:signal transduction histidine kinase